MIISRKKFEQELEKARREVEDRFWQNQRYDELSQHIYSRFEEIDRRVTKLETLLKIERVSDGEAKVVPYHE